MLSCSKYGFPKCARRPYIPQVRRLTGHGNHEEKYVKLSPLVPELHHAQQVQAVFDEYYREYQQYETQCSHDIDVRIAAEERFIFINYQSNHYF